MTGYVFSFVSLLINFKIEYNNLKTIMYVGFIDNDWHKEKNYKFII